ncbi:MAG: permease-like cell division protein FtsX [bacterium]|nr:permease-like cell division protein FtsX [bacterium]
MITSLKRVIRAGWQGFFRDGGLVFVTIFTMTSTILLASSLFLFRDVSHLLITSLREKADFSVYFKEDAPEDDVFLVRDELANIPEVKDVSYISKEQALAEFTARHKDDIVLMGSVQEVGGNPFLSSLKIKVLEASQYQAVAGFLENPNFKDVIEKIDYQDRKPLIERLFSFSSTIDKGGIILSIILFLVAILVSFNTIRLSIYSLREEIKIQRLVGAENWFIRGPFLAQGVIVGVFSALASLLVSSFLIWFLSPKVAILFSGLNLFAIFINHFWLILLLQLATGIGLGTISASLSVRKYLKV